MIPKIIHYVWFGGNPLGELQERCISSWKSMLPDYQIVRWDENNFDIRQNEYCSEAYDAKKWAFASDYARLWVLVHHGGIYMDADVEVISSLDPFLVHSAFSGFESAECVPTGIMACEKGHPFFRELLNYYDNKHFVTPSGSFDQTTNVTIITKACVERGLLLDNTQQTIGGFTLYPSEYFCPKSHDTGLITLTGNSSTIHHFDGTWLDSQTKRLTDVRRELAGSQRVIRGKPLNLLAKVVYGFRWRDFSPLLNTVLKKWR